MTIKRLVVVIFSTMLLFSALLALLTFNIYSNQKKLLESHNVRYDSYLLADQLRQSSDDLTRFARTYALTGDKRYRDYYLEVLAIRNGEVSRPKSYERIYWDLIVDDQLRPREFDPAASLDSLMEKAGFSSVEFEKLLESERLSNELVATEKKAMNSVENYRPAKSQQNNNSDENSLAMAQRILYDQDYHQEKRKIMKPVDDFFVLLNKRTLSSVEEYSNTGETLFSLLIIITVLLLLFSIILSRALIRLVLKPLGEEPAAMSMIANRISQGDLDFEFDEKNSSGVYRSLQIMNKNLKKNQTENEDRAWLQEGEVSIGAVLRNEESLQSLSSTLIAVLCRHVGSHVGALYYWHDGALDNGDGILRRTATFSHLEAGERNLRYTLGQGLVGQAAADMKLTVIEDIPPGYMKIDSASGHHSPSTIVLMPFSHHGELRGLIEMAFLEPFSDIKRTLLDKVSESIGITYENITAKINLNLTLNESQTLSEELQTQQEELRVTNESLIQKSDDLERQAISLEYSQTELRAKAVQLEKSNQYKSEFLANMSHELRTPLNSLLILAHLLADNEEKNLTEDQVESVEVIKQSGESLLGLINNILDLSKVEAGHMTANNQAINTTDLKRIIDRRFVHMAKDKNISFSFDMSQDSPEVFVSDPTRIEQILSNLVANALKFTEHGSVNMHLSRCESPEGNTLKFSVQDTGIGIAIEKQETIFNAFQQADGSTTRQFGGTGLGLAISRKFAALLGGDISLSSEIGSGSTFTLEIPERLLDDGPLPESTIASLTANTRGESDSNNSDTNDSSTDKRLLIVEGNTVGSQSLEETLNSDSVNVDNLKIDVVHTGHAAIDSLLNSSYAAVVLDLALPDISGFDVLRKLTEQEDLTLPPIIIYTDQNLSDNEFLELNNYTDKIVIKSAEDSTERLLDEVELYVREVSAEQYSEQWFDSPTGPIAPDKLKDRCVMLVDDDMRNTFALAKVLRNHGIIVHVAPSGPKALLLLEEQKGIELILMDVMMPGMDGYQTMQIIREDISTKKIPIIALTANAMPEDKEKCLKAGADDYLSKPINPQKLLASLQIWL